MRRMRHPVELGLVCLCVLITAALIITANTPPPHTERLQLATLAKEKNSPDRINFTPPSRRSFAILEERPIFLPSRSIQSQDVEEFQPIQAVTLRRPTSLLLKGVMLSDNDVYAVVQQPETQETKSVTLGDLFGGWTIKEILADHIKVVSGGIGERIELLPHTDGQVQIQKNVPANTMGLTKSATTVQ